MRNLKQIMGDEKGLTAKTLVAAFWSVIGSGGRGVIRLVSNLLLTRILVPEDFGLMATAMVVVTLIQILSDTGVKTALIQNPQGAERTFIDTSFLISIGRSVILFLALYLSRNAIAAYYGIEELRIILSILSAAILIEGFVNPELPLLTRNLNIRKQVFYSVGSQFVGFLITLFLAWSFRSVTALALGYAATSLTRVMFSYLVAPYLPHLRWDARAGKDLFHFGKFIFLNTMITWMGLNADRLIIGKLLGMETLGIYNIALYLGVFASDILVQIFAQSYFPAMSSIAGDGQKVRNMFRRVARSTLLVATPLLLLLALLSEQVVQVLYDDRYSLAGQVLFWIALRSLVQTLNHIQSGTLLALGKPFQVTIANLAGLLILLLTLPVLSLSYGLEGAGMALLISMLLATGLQSIILVKTLGFSVKLVSRSWLIMGSIVLSISTLYLSLREVSEYISLTQSAWILVPVIQLLIPLAILLKDPLARVFTLKEIA